MVKLNRYLIRNAEKLPSPVITVGGQAVMYWLAVYMDAYTEKPDMTFINSIDIDYVARNEGVAAIAQIFNVDAEIQTTFTPPSLAVLALIDVSTGKVKEDEQGLFLNPEVNEANIVDIIDRPSGFESDDFTGEKLALNTELFQVLPEHCGDVTCNDKVRVLNPIACIRSRLSNATVPMLKDPLTEAARIRALAIPAYNFLLEKFECLPFRQGRIYLDYFCSIIWQRNYRRYQIEHKVPLYKIIEVILNEIKLKPDDFKLPEDFYNIELPRKLEYLRTEYERIAKAVNK
ncbi:hypothetical protein EZJ58_0186 [Sodalis ligni]|uniref:Nucleotidyltransferase AbiEii toxin of type IV toxin-antitoxin system n=2 Tax=Sodalis ligni TaxID=2697027 RepID=A0A4R1NDJ6_9GAMM|nr:hypothetical protein EZJ58_0186 [Sodalis ligni]